MLQLEEMIRQSVPEAEFIIVRAGGGGGRGGGGFGFGPGGGGSSHRGYIQIRLTSRSERTRSNDQISQDLRRRLAGLPGTIIRARPSGGNFQMNRMLGGGGDGRLS